MSRAPSFTPGPWRIGEYTAVDNIPIYGVAPNAYYEVCPAFAHSIPDAELIVQATAMYAQLEDAKITLQEVAKAIAGVYPSLANNILNQCAIRCSDILAKARGER